MDKQPILSLCIPTNGVVEWILPVIESIYSQGYDNEKFEVVITDNGKESQLPEHIAKMDYPNLRYKQTSDVGFLNLVSCLKEGHGLFCKMINHRSVLLPGSIANIVSLVERFKEEQPIIYCADGNAKIEDCIYECSNIDEFVRYLSFYCSWSAGIGFWGKDLSKMDSIDKNFLFPNTSLLFEVRDNSKYVIWNEKYQNMGDDSGKGGYDVFKAFGVVLLDILNELRVRNRITINTFISVKSDLFVFLRQIYTNEVVLSTKHTFIIQDVADSMSIYYGKYYYWKMRITSFFISPFTLFRRALKNYYK